MVGDIVYSNMVGCATSGPNEGELKGGQGVSDNMQDAIKTMIINVFEDTFHIFMRHVIMF